jgi:alkylhydroperoxidase family enzyme
MPSDPHRAHLAHLLHQLVKPGCDTEPALRRAILDGKPPAGALGSLAVKVAHNASRITDEQITALKEAGHSDDAIYEVILAASVGAGLERLHKGLALLGRPVPGRGGS